MDKTRHDHVMETLRSVELDDPARIFRSYPHQLSGGLRQRAMIAQAMVCGPELVIADEPTSSLDVTVQAKIMRLLRKLNQERGMTVLLITHDLGMVSHLADTIAVMTDGKIVESGKTADILRAPKHAYTRALIEAY
ncbi:MAG: ABC transporter ATP-binding protein [Candidatus Omnitrophica bacterium]|nr:ABC transporter ATP-binding protein [Candidatus Omnitrophota bacterium]